MPGSCSDSITTFDDSESIWPFVLKRGTSLLWVGFTQTMFTWAAPKALKAGKVLTLLFYRLNSHDNYLFTLGRELLATRVAHGALRNGAEQCDPPKCHPRTRKAVLKEIMKWIDSPPGHARFLWMFGPVGSGKSAIAQTIAELCFKFNKLAATFFFSRNAVARSNELLLITTLVYQLANSFPEMRELLERNIERNPIILDLPLETQIEALLVWPLNEVLREARGKGVEENFYSSRPRLIILDGLDECGDGNTQKYILEVLSRAVSRISFPFIFLIASRPEQAIRNTFNKLSMSIITKRLPLDDRYEPDADMKILIESKCEEIRETHPARASLPSPWPSPYEIEQLVTKSSGQFIYTSTVLNFIESPKHRPQDRLNILFGISATENDAPFAELDALYLQIFSMVIDVDKLRDVLSITLLAAHVPKTQAAIEEFLSYSSGTVDILLSDLSSVIALPLPEEDDGQIQILHASLTDFLYDRSRSVDMFIDVEAAHAFIAIRLMHRFKQPPPQTQEEGDGSCTFPSVTVQPLIHHDIQSMLPSYMTVLCSRSTVSLRDLAIHHS